VAQGLRLANFAAARESGVGPKLPTRNAPLNGAFLDPLRRSRRASVDLDQCALPIPQLCPLMGGRMNSHAEAIMKPLSEQLADLSVRVKNTEDAAAAAQKEAHDKVVARVAEAQAAAEQAVQKINQNVQSASDTASAKWNGLKAKIAADMADLKSKVGERKHDLTVKRAANYSQLLDEEASFAIDYAIASIEQAKVAVLDAIAGRLAVEKAKRTAA
jgi:hypothetical protein